MSEIFHIVSLAFFVLLIVQILNLKKKIHILSKSLCNPQFFVLANPYRFLSNLGETLNWELNFSKSHKSELKKIYPYELIHLHRNHKILEVSESEDGQHFVLKVEKGFNASDEQEKTERQLEKNLGLKIKIAII